MRKTIYLQRSGQKLDPVFTIINGKTVLRMVYDGNGSWLNKFLWYSLLGMHGIDSILRGVGLEAYFEDNDLG